MRKHVVAVSVAAAFCLVLLATTAISISQAINAANSEADAIAARSEMEAALEQSRQLEQQAKASAEEARLESMEGSVAIEVFREVLIGLLEADAQESARPGAPQNNAGTAAESAGDQNAERSVAAGAAQQTSSALSALRQTIDESPRLSRGLQDTLKLMKPMSTTLAASSAVADVAGNLSMLDQVEGSLQVFLSADESSGPFGRPGMVLDFEESLKQGTNAVTLSVLTTVALVCGDDAQAADYAQREIAIRKNIDADDWRLFFAHAQRGEALVGTGDLETARTELTIAWNGLAQFRDQIPDVVRQRRLIHVLEQLSSVCRELGDQTGAKTWQFELATLRSSE